jgi:hypothetical protein
VTDVVDILFGDTGQTLSFIAPEGRPSSVSDFQVWDETEHSDLSTEEDAVGPPTIDTVNTTFDGASGVSQADPTKCALTATTGIVAGRRYLATTSTGATEWVEVVRINSGDSVYGRTHLMHDYVSTNTFQSTRMWVDLDTSWIEDTENLSDPRNPRPRYRMVWTYTVAGTKYRAATFFNLTRYPLVINVNAQDVDRLSRGWLSRLHPDDVQGAGAATISEAHKQVRLDLWEHELSDSAFRNNEIINELVRWRAVWLVADAAFFQGGVGTDQRELAEKRYFQRFDALVRQSKGRTQTSDEGHAGQREQNPIWRR